MVLCFLADRASATFLPSSCILPCPGKCACFFSLENLQRAAGTLHECEHTTCKQPLRTALTCCDMTWQGERQGPFTWPKLSKWVEQGFLQPDLLMERGDVLCWLPLWLAVTAEKSLTPAGKPAPLKQAAPAPQQAAQAAVADGVFPMQ